MTRIAVIADIHGNLPALEAVLGDLERQAPDEVLVGGDLVGRGPEGSAVVGRIEALGWRSVRGNHEDYLLDFRRGDVPLEWLDAEEWTASRWMADELTDHAAAWIADLPFSLVSELAADLRLVHGSTRSHSEGLGPWSTDEELSEQLRDIGESLLVCGHTHRPMQREVSGGQVVNVGSVGLPFNQDQRAQYAIFQRSEGAWSVELRQVEYDVEAELEVYRRTGFLADGGITARLLELELRHAVPFLVPFQRWAVARGVAPSAPQLGAFLSFYEPGESMRTFFTRLREVGAPHPGR